MSSKTGSDLFIVDNSDEEWKVLNGLASRGWLEREDALHAFKAWMGYGKLGSVIEDTVRSLVNGLSRQGRLEAEGSMIRRVGGACVPTTQERADGPAQVDYFVDEAGDTTLFRHGGQPALGRDGVSNFFILGRLELDDAVALAADIATLRQRLLADPLLKAVPSMQPERGKTARFFHAKDDVPEVRVEVFRLLLAHELRFSAIVKDKRALLREAQAALAADPRAKYKPDGHALYDAMMRKLFARLGRHGVHSRITFAVRGSKPRTAALKHAVLEVEQHFERDFGFARNVSIDVASGYPWNAAGLQACDYFLWALQRFYERGEERFLNAMWPQFVEVIDMDLEAKKRRGKPRERGVTFTKENPLGLATRAGLKIEPGDIG